MARLWQCGFETNSAGANQEITGPLAAAGLISSAQKHGGSYSLNIATPTSAQAKGHYFQYRSAEATDHLFFRTYLRYTGTLPSAENRIMFWNDSTALTTPSIYITIDNNGALRLYDEDGQIGSASSNLAADTWYRFELEYDTTLGNNNHVVTARIDGSNFASASNRFIAGTNQPYFWVFGLNLNSEANTAGSLFFDDMAINDANGASQNSWPGIGFIVHIMPNNTGDNGDWTNDYTYIDETPPDSGSTYISSNTVNQIEDVNLTATPAALDTNAAITVVAVGVHFAGASASANASFQLRLKEDTGGTVATGAAVTPTGTGYRNNSYSNPAFYSLVTYARPGGSDPWTKAYLDTAQAGVICSTGNTNAVRISTLWVSIEYIPPTAIALAKAALVATGRTIVVENTTATITIPLAKASTTALGRVITVANISITVVLDTALLAAIGRDLPNTYYVDATTGSDSDNGLTPDTAWQTISKVNGFTFHNGDTVLFKRGETWAEYLVIPMHEMTISAYGTGAEPTITGSDVRDKCVFADGKDRITIDGIKVISSVWEGIDIENSEGPTVQNCVANGCGIGMLIGYSTLFDVNNNTVENCNRDGISIQNSTNGDVQYNGVAYCGLTVDDRSGISLFTGCENVRVHHNISRDHTNVGTTGIRGIIVDTNGDLVNYVYQNICHHCDGAGIMVEQSNNQQIYNNICYANGSSSNWNDGIKFSNSTGGYCYHNTCYGNRNSAIRCINASSVVIKNNIGWQTGNRCVITEGTGATTHTIDYNNWYGVTTEYTWNGTDYSTEGDFFSATGQGEHDFTTDPLTVSTSDFHLQPDSPCVGVGATGLGIAIDFDGITRGSPPDVGAYELIEPVIIIFDVAQAQAIGQLLTVVEGERIITLAKAALNASGQVSTVVPGTRAILLNASLLIAQGQAATIVKGAVAIAFDQALVTAVGRVLTVSAPAPGATVALAVASLTAAGRLLFVAPGGVTIQVDPATTLALGRSLSLSLGGVTIPLDQGLLNALGRNLSLSLGGVTIPFDQAITTTLGQSLSLGLGGVAIPLDQAILTALGRIITVTAPPPGAITIPLDLAQLIAAGRNSSLLMGGVSLPLDTALLVALGRSITLDVPAAGVVALSAAALLANGRPLSLLPGGVSLPLSRGLLLANGQQASVSSVTSILLALAGLSANGLPSSIIPGAVNLPLDLASIIAFGQPISLVSGSIIPLDLATLVAAGLDLSLLPGPASVLLAAALLNIYGQTTALDLQYRKRILADLACMASLEADVYAVIDAVYGDVIAQTILRGEVKL